MLFQACFQILSLPVDGPWTDPRGTLRLPFLLQQPTERGASDLRAGAIQTYSGLLNSVSVTFGRTLEPLKPELHKSPGEATAHLVGVQSAFPSDAEESGRFRGVCRLRLI